MDDVVEEVVPEVVPDVVPDVVEDVVEDVVVPVVVVVDGLGSDFLQAKIQKINMLVKIVSAVFFI